MKKQIFILSAIIISLFLISMISAQIKFYQMKEDMGNGTIRNRILLTFTKEGAFADDYILGNDPFEAYLQYNFNVQSSNQLNPNLKVSYCNLKIWVWKSLQPNQTLVFEKNFTDSEPDTNNAQYFFQLYDKDQAIAQQECYFLNPDFHQLQLPAEMQMVQPTTECKACQFYIWSKLEADISRTQLIGNNVLTISDYIQKLVALNFEIIIVLFWIGLILLLFVGVGLIFIAVYWLFLYLYRIGK